MFIAADCHKHSFAHLDATLHVLHLTTCIRASETGSMALKKAAVAGKTQSHEGQEMPHACNVRRLRLGGSYQLEQDTIIYKR